MSRRQLQKAPPRVLFVQCHAVGIKKDPDGNPHEMQCTEIGCKAWMPSDKGKAIEWYCVPHWNEKFNSEVMPEHTAYMKAKRLKELESK